MKRISEIYSSYKGILDRAQDEYEQSVKNGAENTKEFYEHFFKDLTVNIGKMLKEGNLVNNITDEIERFFGKRELDFIAVDGSCHKRSSAEFITFYGGAYGSKGVLSLSKDSPSLKYKKWEIEKDVSMVAFIPVPYSKIHEIHDDNVRDTDSTNSPNILAIPESEKMQLTNIHLPIMQLAEVFLAYNSATSSNIDRPNIILIDNNLSNMLGYNDIGVNKIPFIGKLIHGDEQFSRQDVIIAQAHPFNNRLCIPSTKRFTEKSAVIRFLHENSNREINRAELLNIGLDEAAVKRVISKLESDEIIEVTTSNTLRQKLNVYKSWENTKQTFQRICKSIFLDKRENTLKYKASDDDENLSRWMSPNDIRFLITVGVRALIEECWSNKILLTGIVKDSASTYMTKNYLDVCKHCNKYENLSREKLNKLPPTDRLFCELLPYIDDELEGPWGTIEFDSTFMTLRVEENGGAREILGSFEGITRPERLFLRSIGQFYVRRDTVSPLTGHAIFIDRLAFPEFDGKAERLEINNTKLGIVEPFFYLSSDTPNMGQLMTYYLLKTLTRNLFAEVIGYPDPLHKADQGAKSMRNNVGRLIDSSEIRFRTRPLVKTLRDIRRSFGR